MVSNKLIKKFRDNHPKYNHWDDETVDNWLEQRRDLDIYAVCPSHARGRCCWSAKEIPLPSIELCDKACSEYLRNKCEFDRSNIPETSKMVYILLPKQKCKFLGDDNLCSEYENRFWKFRHCMKIKDAIKGGAVPKDCAYLTGKNKRKYIKNPHKLEYDFIEDKLCEWGRLTYKMTNESPQIGKYSLKEY